MSTFWNSDFFLEKKYAPVAQLDRVAVSGTVGRRFESSRACHFKTKG